MIVSKDFMIDELGRIRLPQELREKLNWNAKDSLYASINAEDNTVILKKIINNQGSKCVFCGEYKATLVIKDTEICRDCIETIKKCPSILKAV